MSIQWSARVEDVLVDAHVFACENQFPRLTPSLVLLTALQKYARKASTASLRKLVFDNCLRDAKDIRSHHGRVEFDDDLMLVIKECLERQALSKGYILSLGRLVEALARYHGVSNPKLVDSGGVCSLDVF